MSRFFYNKEILEDIESDESLVICAGLGSGKSQSVKEYLSKTNGGRILLIVNETQAQDDYYHDLSEKIILCNSKGYEYSIKDFTEAFTMITEERNCVCITKVKFDMLLTAQSMLLHSFDKVIIDEYSGLNPIVVSDLKADIDIIANNFTAFISDFKSETHYKQFTEITMYLKHIKQKYESNNDCILFYQDKVEKKLRDTALDLLKYLRKLYDKGQIHNILDFRFLFHLLNAISNNTLYLGDMPQFNGKKKTFMLFANTFLNDYIKCTFSTIKILDGTAFNVKSLYDWLNIKIKDDYTCNKKQFPNLKLHIHRYKNLTPAKGRKNEDITKDIVDLIIKDQANSKLTFATKFLVDSKRNLFAEFDLVDYAMSGRDVGSNIYREHTEMNVIYYQTLPQHYRMLWNRLFKKRTFEESCSSTCLREAEQELVGVMLAQLIGRTKIRMNNEEHVNIHLHCVSIENVATVVNHFKLNKTNIVVYDEVDLGIEGNEKDRKSIIESLDKLLYKREIESLDVIAWLKENYYQDKDIDKIKKTYQQIKDKIINIGKVNRYKLKTTRGRNSVITLVRL